MSEVTSLPRRRAERAAPSGLARSGAGGTAPPGPVLLRPAQGWRAPGAADEPVRQLSLRRTDPATGLVETVRLVAAAADPAGRQTYAVEVTAASETHARQLVDLALERLRRERRAAAHRRGGPSADEIAEALAEAPEWPAAVGD